MAQPMHMQPFQFQGPPGDKLGWEQRIVKWADDYLKKLRGGTLAYPHETGAGKPQAQSLRGFLLSGPVLAVLQNSKVDTSYGNSMRLSAESTHTARVIPQQEQARQQYYLDLFADDVALLERIKSMLGSQPVLEKEAVWTTFGKVFTELDRSRVTKPTELASTLEFAYEELKMSLGEKFEQKLVDAWDTVLDHLLKDVFAGQLKFVGDEFARDRATIRNPNELLAKIRKACQAVHEIRNNAVSLMLSADARTAKRAQGPRRRERHMSQSTRVWTANDRSQTGQRSRIRSEQNLPSAARLKPASASLALTVSLAMRHHRRRRRKSSRKQSRAHRRARIRRSQT